MKFFQNKKKKEKNRPFTISIKLVSKCCGARIEYSEFYILAALMGEELFRCTECGKDPCWVEEKNAG